MKLIAYQISESNNIENFKQGFKGRVLKSTSSEILFGNEKNQYIYLFNYGVVCFWDYNEDEINLLLQQLIPLSTNPLSERIGEVYQVLFDSEITEVGYYKSIVNEFDFESAKLFMLYLSQSTTLTYYRKQTDKLLDNIQLYTSSLEKFGNFKISWSNLKKFIGKALSINNRISNNLYILESPPNAWNNDYLNKIDQELKEIFKIHSRTQIIQENINRIKENLDLFTSITFHKKGEALEWIVIWLIVIEVINTFAEKIF